MFGRSQVFKIIGIIIIFLVSLQYLYLYPIKLKLGFSSSNVLINNHGERSSLDSSETEKGNKSLFHIKTAVSRKRSPDNFQEDEKGGNEIHLRKSNHSLAKGANSQQQFSQSTNLSGQDVQGKLSPHQRISSQVSSSPTPIQAPSSSPPSKNPHNLPICPERPSTLLGLVKVSLSNPPSLQDIGRLHEDIELGGHYKPRNCTSKDKVAIIVPFRDREDHLRLFLYNILPFLKRQQIDFNIYVIEQGGVSGDEPFNRAMLFNVGFAEADKRGEYDCFIFHDVDLIPENDYNLYNCPLQPRHMSVAVDKMKYQLPYRTLFGGISALTKAHFLKVNGFSNSFWGWGAEDDDMAGRIAFNGLYISRPPPNIARYKMLKHKQQKLNHQRWRVLQKGKGKFRTEGLNNLKYNVEQVVMQKTYTLVRVRLTKP